MATFNLRKIYKMFDNENDTNISADALEQLQQWQLIPREGQYLCAQGHPLRLLPSSAKLDGFLWRCHQKSARGKRKPRTCSVQISIRKNTFFYRSKLPMVKLIAFSYLWIKNVPQDFITEELSISLRTAIEWSNCCREVVYTGMNRIGYQIGGAGSVVEIGESEFGRRKYDSGRGVEGQWVFGGVERGTNRCFLVPVEQRDKETLLAIIKRWILPHTTIVSDFWKEYHCLRDEGYVHLKQNHSINFKNPQTQEHTNTIEELWRHAKHSMPQHHRNKKILSEHLAKFLFTRHCKLADLDALNVFFEMAGLSYNPMSPYLDIREDDIKEELKEE
ncbi:uncharacterized protein LOC118741046 [Rhagoletis pomonella]|uniref:uncharacterized protein LOC118741046 n=1 Tax=Rhagoletis pomonella TaxID=28610 RepID=UPI00177D5772|nr:uncharacterized protein LOC118741046 [Rhagoletis pomonella]